MDENIFERNLHKFYKKLCELEMGKHLIPKYSCALKELAEYYKFNKDTVLPETSLPTNKNKKPNNSLILESLKNNIPNEYQAY